MGPPSRSFAADAHDCIVVAILTDRPNTSSWRAICAHDGELPLGIVSVADTELEKTRPDRASLPLCLRPSRASRSAMAFGHPWPPLRPAA